MPRGKAFRFACYYNRLRCFAPGAVSHLCGVSPHLPVAALPWLVEWGERAISLMLAIVNRTCALGQAFAIHSPREIILSKKGDSWGKVDGGDVGQGVVVHSG